MIQKLKTTVRYPDFPQSGNDVEITFKYWRKAPWR
jgi:hypothetical protein